MPAATPERPWLSWYSKSGWVKRARQQLREQPLCCMCLKENQVVPATVADHVIPHKGNYQLFWFGPLQSLCAPHHSSTKQQQETKGYVADIGNDGWPKDPAHPANKY